MADDDMADNGMAGKDMTDRDMADKENDMTGKAENSDLSAQIKAIQAELLALTETVRTYSSQHASAGAEAVRDAAGRAGEAARHTAEEARRRGERVAEDLETHITANPLPSVLIAAGVGLVIGAILGRR